MTRIRLVVLIKLLARWVIKVMALASPMAARVLIMLHSGHSRDKGTRVAVAEVVTVAVVLNQRSLRREINVVVFAYPMALRLLKVLIPGSARDEVPVTPQAPMMTLRVGPMAL